MKYSVTYGVNDSHLTECELFPLYRDALAFFNAIDTAVYPSAICYKLGYNKDGYVCAKEAKQYNLQTTKGTTDWKLFNELIINPTL